MGPFLEYLKLIKISRSLIYQCLRLLMFFSMPYTFIQNQI